MAKAGNLHPLFYHSSNYMIQISLFIRFFIKNKIILAI